MPARRKSTETTQAAHSKRPPGRPRKDSNLDTRQKLLDAAGELSRSKPINQISMREVALNAGLSPALARYYFASTTELQSELLRIAWQKMNVGGSFRYEPGTPLDEVVTSNLRKHIRTIIESPELASLLIQHILFGQPETIQVFIDEILEPTRDATEAIFAEGARQGIFNEVNGMDLTITMLGATAFYSIAASDLAPAFGKKRVTRKNREQFIDDLVEMAIHFLLKDK